MSDLKLKNLKFRWDILKKKERGILKILRAFNALEEDQNLSRDERVNREALCIEFQLLVMKETYWHPRSKIKWLKEGDHNTKFFHKVAAHQRNSNGTYGLWINGEWIMNQVEISKEVESYYLNLFKDDYPVRPSLDGLEFDRISCHERRWIERPFSKDEVHISTMSMKGKRVLDEFYYSEEFYEHLNNNFTVLIPKKKSAKEMKDFSPISFLSSVYKIRVYYIMTP